MSEETQYSGLIEYLERQAAADKDQADRLYDRAELLRDAISAAERFRDLTQAVHEALHGPETSESAAPVAVNDTGVTLEGDTAPTPVMRPHADSTDRGEWVAWALLLPGGWLVINKDGEGMSAHYVSAGMMYPYHIAPLPGDATQGEWARWLSLQPVGTRVRDRDGEEWQIRDYGFFHGSEPYWPSEVASQAPFTVVTSHE